MTNIPRAKEAYWAQKANAKARGKDWKFTLEEWISWWEEKLGANWLEKRGTKTGSHYQSIKRGKSWKHVTKDLGPAHRNKIGAPRKVKIPKPRKNRRIGTPFPEK